MSGKASISDFGLYREKQKETHIKSLKFVIVFGGVAAVFLGCFYLIVHLTKSGRRNDNVLEVTLEKPAEKLMASESINRAEVINLPPKPFGVTYRGAPPQEFTSTTEKVTTLNYPQLNAYRNRRYPHNIQDVIGYVNQYNKPFDITKYNRNYYKESSSQRHARNFSEPTENDPFYRYKPQDPSDINLLATASFRFAPPLWSNIRQKFPKTNPQQQLPENTNRQEVFRDQTQKPIVVTLNVYPNENDYRGQHRYGMEALNRHHRMEFVPKLRFGNNPRQMVIHLNVFPDPAKVGKGDVRETKLQKKIVLPIGSKGKGVM